LIALLPKGIADDLAITAVEGGASKVGGGFFASCRGGDGEEVDEEEERGERVIERSYYDSLYCPNNNC
jgi:hypothetical protein